jgi:hypothetical protein
MKTKITRDQWMRIGNVAGWLTKDASAVPLPIAVPLPPGTNLEDYRLPPQDLVPPARWPWEERSDPKSKFGPKTKKRTRKPPTSPTDTPPSIPTGDPIHLQIGEPMPPEEYSKLFEAMTHPNQIKVFLSTMSSDELGKFFNRLDRTKNILESISSSIRNK